MKTSCKLSGDRTEVKLVGDLNEACEAELTSLGANLTTPKVDIDCKGIRYINSIGVGHWMNFIRAVGKKAKITYANCPVTFIEYATLLPSFLGPGRVLSFEVPYGCSACDRGFRVITETDSLASAEALPPHACPSCAEPAEPDCELADYLSFLGAKDPPQA
jgi:hypothetical protein